MIIELNSPTLLLCGEQQYDDFLGFCYTLCAGQAVHSRYPCH